MFEGNMPYAPLCFKYHTRFSIEYDGHFAYCVSFNSVLTRRIMLQKSWKYTGLTTVAIHDLF